MPPAHKPDAAPQSAVMAASVGERVIHSPRSDAARAVVLREEIDELIARTIARGEELRERVKTLDPGHPREPLLASILRLTEKAREEQAELRRALG